MLSLGRRNEISDARWSEVTQDDYLAIGAERMKAGRDHLVPLSDAALRVLAEQDRYLGCDFIFTTNGERPIRNFGTIKAALDRTIGEDGGPKMASWTFHDFRRAGVTWLASKRIRIEVADTLLAHAPTSMSATARIYQKFDFLDERVAALRMWADFLDGTAPTGARQPLRLIASGAN
jgi:integrase